MSAPKRCRFCGKPVPKQTFTVYFGASEQQIKNGSSTAYWIYRAERPTSKDEAQRLVNQEIVHVRWTRGNDIGARDAGFDYISQVSTWDGESYISEFFCNGSHAQSFGIAAARGGLATEAYRDAVDKDKKKENAIAQ